MYQTLRCSLCHKAISSPLPEGVQIRAWIECYSCNIKDERMKTIKTLIVAIHDAAVEANWCNESLAEALTAAENCLPKYQRLQL